MDESIIRESVIWGVSVLTGAGILASYDVLRLLRHIIPHAKWAIDGEDVLFWICCFPVLFHLLYYQNTENMRFYEVLGAICGMGLYQKWIHKNVSKLLTLCEKKVKLVIESLFRKKHVGK